MHILLVDDDAFSRKLMGYYLKPMAEATVDMAEGGQDCLNQVASKRPDLILMDCQMPGMDGFETVTRLRDSGYSGVILALTGNSDEETLRRCSQVGMNGHLGKPVDATRLREAILQALGQQESSATPAPAGSASPTAAGSASAGEQPEDPLARARSIAKAANNPAFLTRLVTAFVKSTEENLSQLRSALESSDRAAVAAMAHKIRGSAGTFGAATFSQTAGRLEDSLQSQTLDECQSLVQGLLELWPPLRSQLEISGGSS